MAGRGASSLTGFAPLSAAMREIGNADRHEFGVDSTIARKTRISRFDDKRGLCSVFEARRRSRNSAQFMLRSTTIFNQERHLVIREIYKQRRSAALGEWRALMT
jgi:putative transposase